VTLVLFKTILFFLIALLYFYSISGYGKLIYGNYLKKTNYNFFELFIFGSIFQIILGFLIHISFGTNEYFNTFVLILGSILYFFYKKELNNVSLKYVSGFFLVIFSVLLISKTHADFVYYHHWAVHEIFYNKIRIGTYLLNQNYFYSSLLAYSQSLIVIPFFDFKLIHFPIFFIYFSVLGYFIFLSLKKINNSERFFSLMIVMILLIKFNRLTEFGYDYISQFLLLIVFHKIYFYKKNQIELKKAISFFMLCILIKPNSLLFFPIILYLLYGNRVKFLFSLINFKNFLFYAMIFVLLSTSFLRSGCVFYPINATCFSKEKVFWSEKKNVKEFSKHVSLWAKAYNVHIKKGTKYKQIIDREEYNKSLNWFKYWVEHHFFYKIFEFFLIIISIMIIIHIYLTREKPFQKQITTEYNILFCLSFISLIFWLLIIPQFRFGFSIIIIFIYLLLNYFLKFEISLNKKKFLKLILLSLFILNLKNIVRIQDRFEREDFWKFTNFPFYNAQEIKKIKDRKTLNIEKENFFYIEIFKPGPT
jgi:hypothetical protein